MDSTVDNCEDYDLLLRAAVLGYIPQYTGSCAVYYRQHPESVTAQPVRQYLTDAKMHKKLAEHLNDNPAFPRGNRLEGLLAFSAGALETAALLYPEHRSISDELLDLTLEQIKAAKNAAIDSHYGLSFPLQLFSLKMLCTLSRPPLRVHGAAKRIHENLKTILRSTHASTAVLSMAGVIMKTTFQDRQHSIMERLYLLKLFFQFGLSKYFNP
jgi:hypothetical protein